MIFTDPNGDLKIDFVRSGRIKRRRIQSIVYEVAEAGEVSYGRPHSITATTTRGNRSAVFSTAGVLAVNGDLQASEPDPIGAHAHLYTANLTHRPEVSLDTGAYRVPRGEDHGYINNDDIKDEPPDVFYDENHIVHTAHATTAAERDDVMSDTEDEAADETKGQDWRHIVRQSATMGELFYQSDDDDVDRECIVARVRCSDADILNSIHEFSTLWIRPVAEEMGVMHTLHIRQVHIGTMNSFRRKMDKSRHRQAARRTPRSCFHCVLVCSLV